eukprot:15110975-Alexandrium_andersonii.AAC.1
MRCGRLETPGDHARSLVRSAPRPPRSAVFWAPPCAFGPEAVLGALRRRGWRPPALELASGAPTAK